jgi:hypothetical protein
MSATQNPKTGKPWEGGSYVSATFDIDVSNITGKDIVLYICLAYQSLMPLVSGKLNAAETLREEFHVAQSFVHEFMVSQLSLAKILKSKTYLGLQHACNYADRNFNGSAYLGYDFEKTSEPYFEWEQEDE